MYKPIPRRTSNGTLVGKSLALGALLDAVDRVAFADCTVLLTGESGTGKGLIVAALHDASRRAAGPLVALNCAAVPEALMESTLFGHARGAFTGAFDKREGSVARAEGGTLFLDEVGELPLGLQPKLLRVLQDREYTPVGGDRARRSNVRYVAATNRDLAAEVARGTFREDLYYRLNVIPLHVPPLRERPVDIEPLVRHFFGHFRVACNRDDLSGLSQEAYDALSAYAWPGNVRELENTLQRIVLLSAGPVIQSADVASMLGDAPISSRSVPLNQRSLLPHEGVNLRAVIAEYETQLMREALERTCWNKNQAARLLGLNRTTLVEMIKRKKLRRSA